MSRVPVLAYLYWAVVGIGFAFGAASLLTIGVFVLPVAVVLAGVGLAIRPLRNHSMLAAIAGLSAPLFYIAWLNRGGPGEMCRIKTAEAFDCFDAWNPWPFVAVGVVLLVSAVLAVRSARQLSATRA